MQKIIIAIDPGPTESAYVLYRDGEIAEHDKVDNDTMILALGQRWARYPFASLVIEQIAAMGLSVGAEVFETCVWTGQFMREWERVSGRPADRVKRHAVKMAICQHPRAKDGNIRQAIIDRYGGKVAAIGSKKLPGPLYGMAGDEWQALALAITYAESRAA